MFVEADDEKISITVVKLVGFTVLAARLNGTLSFYKLEVLLSYSANESKSRSAKPRRGEYANVVHTYIDILVKNIS